MGRSKFIIAAAFLVAYPTNSYAQCLSLDSLDKIGQYAIDTNACFRSLGSSPKKVTEFCNNIIPQDVSEIGLPLSDDCGGELHAIQMSSDNISRRNQAKAIRLSNAIAYSLRVEIFWAVSEIRQSENKSGAEKQLHLDRAASLLDKIYQRDEQPLKAPF